MEAAVSEQELPADVKACSVFFGSISCPNVEKEKQDGFLLWGWGK